MLCSWVLEMMPFCSEISILLVSVDWWLCLAALFVTGSNWAWCRKDWKRISAESSLLSPRWPNLSRDWAELNWTELNWIGTFHIEMVPSYHLLGFSCCPQKWFFVFNYMTAFPGYFFEDSITLVEGEGVGSIFCLFKMDWHSQHWNSSKLGAAATATGRSL